MENKWIVGEYYGELGSSIIIIAFDENKKSALRRMKNLKECEKSKNFIALKVEDVADEIDVTHEIKEIDRKIEALQNKRKQLINENGK